jgi:hypothetical protein
VSVARAGDHVDMSRTRFAILLATVVALNSFFWLATSGFALPQQLIDRFFGPRLIRAEVILGGAQQVNDFRIDRGVITAASSGSITIRERDGTVVTIATSATTRVVGRPRINAAAQLRPAMRVLVVRKANEPATQIQIEGRGLAGP